MKCVAVVDAKLQAFQFFQKSGRGLQGQGRTGLKIVSTERSCHKQSMCEV